jgi:hypothetical protein
MPTFYFHIINGFGHTPDEEGQALTSLQQAREAAVKGARSIMSAEVLEGRIDVRGRIEIEDEQGATLLTVPFAEAVQVVDGALDPEGKGA